MQTELILLVSTTVVLAIVALEVAAAVLPLLIVVTLVPSHERTAVAEMLAAIDSSRRLRLWPALRVAVAARRSAIGTVTADQPRAARPTSPKRTVHGRHP
jgi:hypothetical protein